MAHYTADEQRHLASSGLSRRRLLIGGGLAVAGPVLAACGATATPTTAPAKAEATTAPAATAAPAAAATAPAAAATPAGTAAPAAATKPAATAAPATGATPAATTVPAAGVAKDGLKGEITWWAWGNEQTGFQVWRKQIELYNRKYPNIKVNVQPALGYDKVAVTIAAGTAADIIMINVPSGYAFIGKGGIFSLQPFINADRDWIQDLEKFNTATIESHKFRGELYAIPQSLETSGTIYNEDMIREAGLTPPAELGDAWTWDKFAEYAAKMTKGDGTDKVYGAYLSPDPQSGLGDFAYPLGAKWVTDDGVTTGADSPEFIQAAEFLVNLAVTQKVAPPPSALTGQNANAYALFINKKIGMMLSGDWAFGWIVTRQLPDQKFKMNWMTSPKAPNGKFAAVGHTVAQGGYAKTKQKEAVVGFMREYSTKESQQLITDHWETYPALAPRNDAQDSFWRKGLIPNEKALRASFQASLPYPRTPVADASPIVVKPINDALNAVLDGKDTRKVDVILKEVAQKINGDLVKAARE